MAFLDNSGDIILDAVLTDTGRARLARGDGSFTIKKFVLADDEINYSLYDKDHPSGSAYYDLNILQTPVFEAFTNNASSVKSTLLTLTRSNLLYLPVLKINNKNNATLNISGIDYFSTSNVFVVSSNTTTTSKLGNKSFLNGVTQDDKQIRIDQGIDSNEFLTFKDAVPADLKEETYLIELHKSLGTIVNPFTSQEMIPNFIDDDNIATYVATKADLVKEYNRATTDLSQGNGALQPEEVISGPKGTLLAFRVQVSQDLQASTYLFTKLGGIVTIDGLDYYYIDTFTNVRGATTGASITVPLRFLKYKE
jgi:hypothetical protein